MNWWKKLLKNRKRSDRVKIMLYLGIAAAIFLALTAVNVIELVKYINTPTEYILSCNTVSDAVLDQLMTIEGVSAVTPTENNSLILNYKANEATLNVVSISKEYAKSVYGVERKGEIPTLFANSTAYKRILSELVGVNSDTNLQNEIKVDILLDDKYKVCRIVKIDQKINAEEPFVFEITADSVLKAHADSIRVFVSRQDTEQLTVGRIQNLGHAIMNRDDILSFHNQIDRLFLEMKYHMIIAVMCVLWIVTLRRFASDRRI